MEERIGDWLKHKKYLALIWRFSNYCTFSSQRNNLITLIHYNERKKMAYARARAKENLKLNHSGPRQGIDDRLIMCHGQYSHT